MIFKQQLIKDLNDLQRELDGEDHEILNCVSEGDCSKAYLGDLKRSIHIFLIMALIKVM